MSGTRVWHFAGDGGRDGALLDRGFRYGMSVFETLAVAGGRVLFFDEHAQRLASAARALLGVDIPDVLEWARGLQAAEAWGPVEGILRMYVTAGPGGLTDPVGEPSAAAIFEPATIESGAGAAVVFCSAPYVGAPGGWKTGNYWQNVRALADARSRGADEAILFAPGGAAAGCACGNLFAVVGGVLKTPALECGARDGVVRAWVMARQPVEEALLDASDLLAASELFFTNSRRGIAAIRSLEGRLLGSSPAAAGLATLYAREVLHR